MNLPTRRRFLKELGLSAAALPFISGLPGLRAENVNGTRKQRLILMASPDGTIPEAFWPDQTGADFAFKTILEPLAPFREKTLVLKGVSNKVRGDGDNHMRGMSCLLTGIELFPGNIQGGSDTPAGWASGISIDQEIRNFLQGHPESNTRFGSLELGVAVPDQADPWTRWSYAGPNKPLAPMDNPYLLFEKLYGQMKDKESLSSIVDELREDFDLISKKVGAEDKALLEEHVTLVREMELELQRADSEKTLTHAMPPLTPGIAIDNDQIPKMSRMQIDLMVNALANDMARIATLQYTRSVGNARMTWLGITDGQHTLSHEPDSNAEAVEKLTKINRWYCEELAYLAQKLSDTPEPGGTGSMLDHTLIVWTNELGKGNSHTLDNIPFVLVGNGADFKMGRSLDLQNAAHNQLWMAIARAMGHGIDTFGNPTFCEGGPLDLVS